MKKLTFPLILSAFALASCGANSPGTPIESVTSKGESTSQPATSSQPATTSQPTITSQAEESDVTVLAALHLGFYNRYANQEAADGFKNGFETYLKEKKARITSLTIDVIGGSSDNVETFETAVKQNDEAKDYNVDAVLGGKANFVGYVKENFTSYKDGDAYVEFALGTKTDRRLLLRNDSPNDDALFFLVNYVRTLAGLPEIADDPTEDSSETVEPVDSDPVESKPVESQPEESLPEESSAAEESKADVSEPTQSSEEATESVPVSLQTLHVVFYEHFVPADQQPVIQQSFADFLSGKGIEMDVTYNSFVSANSLQDFDDAVSAFESQPDAPYVFDVIFGVKAKLKTYVTEHFEEYKPDGVTTEYSMAGQDDRRLFTRKGTDKIAEIQFVIDYLWQA